MCGKVSEEETIVVTVLSQSWSRVLELQRGSLFRSALTSFICLAFHGVFLHSPADSDVSAFELQVA